MIRRSKHYKMAFFYGDSNTYGYDPAGFMGGRYPRESRWTTILQHNIAGVWRIDADGMPGRALPVTGYEWDYLRSMIRQRMPFDLFAVMLGTNDLLSTLHPDAAKAARKMNDLVTFVQEVMEEWEAEHADADLGPGASVEEDSTEEPRVLIIAPPRIELTDQSYAESYVAGDASLGQSYEEEAMKLAGFYRELAEYRHVYFADASKWELPFAFDGVHLSEGGHAAFAAEMVDVLRRIWSGPPHSCDNCVYR